MPDFQAISSRMVAESAKTNGLPVSPSREFNDDEDFLIEHQKLFASIYNQGGISTYYTRFDESLRRGQLDALAMRNDTSIFELLRHRMYKVLSLPHHLKSDRPKDKRQIEICERGMRLIDATDDWEDLELAAYEAIWYGKAGSQQVFHRDMVDGSPAVVCSDHQPIMGDKIIYAFDGTPGVLLYGGSVQEVEEKGGEIFRADIGPAVKLSKPYWRDRFIIHKHEPSDYDYIYEAEKAGGVHGIGLRDRIYWAWWLRQEVLAWCMNAMQRIGANGNFIGYYEMGNAASKTAVIEALKTFSAHGVSAFPRSPGAPSGMGTAFDHIPPTAIAYEVMMRLIEYLDGIIRRAIVGQEMTGVAKSTGMNSNQAEVQQDTLDGIQAYDAKKLAGCLTRDFVKVLMKLNKDTFGELNFNIKLVLEVQEDEFVRKLDSASKIVAMGGQIDLTDLIAEAGLKQIEPGSPAAKLLAATAQNGAGPNGKPAAGPNGKGPGGGGSGGAPPLLGGQNGSNGTGKSISPSPDRMRISSTLATIDRYAADRNVSDEPRDPDGKWTRSPRGPETSHNPSDPFGISVPDVAPHHRKIHVRISPKVDRMRLGDLPVTIDAGDTTERLAHARSSWEVGGQHAAMVVHDNMRGHVMKASGEHDDDDIAEADAHPYSTITETEDGHDVHGHFATHAEAEREAREVAKAARDSQGDYEDEVIVRAGEPAPDHSSHPFGASPATHHLRRRERKLSKAERDELAQEDRDDWLARREAQNSNFSPDERRKALRAYVMGRQPVGTKLARSPRGPERYAAEHDVSDEPRDSDGKWTRSDQSYRGRHEGSDVMPRSGYVMFSDDLESISQYAGDNGRFYSVSHDKLMPIGELEDAIRNAWDDEDKRPSGYEQLDSDEILAAFNPSDIVNSAEGYDNEDFTSWLWENVLEPQGIMGIKTEDGAIVFDPAIIDDLGSVDDWKESYGSAGTELAGPERYRADPDRSSHVKLSGGRWVTIKGHAVYIKDGKIVAGGIPGFTHDLEGTPLHKPSHAPAIGKRTKARKSKSKDIGEKPAKVRHAISEGNIVGKAEHVYAEGNEKRVARLLSGKHLADNEPVDVVVHKDNKEHGIEVKTLAKGKKRTVTMHPDALLRKAEYAEADPNRTVHTVAIDHRDRFAKGAYAENHSGHELYYKRGAGAYALSKMHKVADHDELNRLIHARDEDLPEAARGELPKGKALDKLRSEAEKAHASRLKKDQIYKARKRAERMESRPVS